MLDLSGIFFLTCFHNIEQMSLYNSMLVVFGALDKLAENSHFYRAAPALNRVLTLAINF